MAVTVSIAKKTFALAFTLDALDEIERMIPDFNMSAVAEAARRPRYMVDILYAMAKQGELLEGRELSESRAWFGAHIPAAPKKIAEIQIAIFNAMTDAVKMENESDDSAEKDVVLEELKKNGEKESSPTA